jgi:hypothetical protein
MRSAVVLIVVSIAVCGCSERKGQPGLEPLARGLLTRPEFARFVESESEVAARLNRDTGIKP